MNDQSFQIYLILLALYLLIHHFAPDRPLEETDNQPEGEEQFFTTLALLFFAWWGALLMPIVTKPLAIIPPAPAIYAGCCLFFVGAVLRGVAIRTLGHTFTYKLCIRENHELVTTGVYRYLRNPGYIGAILECTGMLVVARSLPGLILFTLVAVKIYGSRIPREEKMMLDHFGDEYAEYMKKTKRLIPGVY